MKWDLGEVTILYSYMQANKVRRHVTRAVFRGGAGARAVSLPRFEEKYKLPLKGVV